MPTDYRDHVKMERVKLPSESAAVYEIAPDGETLKGVLPEELFSQLGVLRVNRSRVGVDPEISWWVRPHERLSVEQAQVLSAMYEMASDCAAALRLRGAA